MGAYCRVSEAIFSSVRPHPRAVAVSRPSRVVDLDGRAMGVAEAAEFRRRIARSP